MADPLITVLMTVYNGGDYLKAAVQSILNQSFEDYEFLIIDDCSTDDALARIRLLNDSRVCIHRNLQNLGQTKSLNVGLHLVRAKYVARIDADDLAFPDWLKNQYAFFSQHPEYAVVSSKAVVIDERGRVLKRLNTPDTYQGILLKAVFASPINHVGSLMRKDVVLQFGGYDENFKIAADYDLWSRLLRDGQRLASTPAVGVAVRCHGDSASVVEKGRRDIVEVPLIIQANIAGLSRAACGSEDALTFWRLIYIPGTLSEEEFLSSLQRLKEVYEQWDERWGITKDVALAFWQKQEKVLVAKWIFALARAGEGHRVRRFIKNQGWRKGYKALFIIFWGSSILGRSVLQCIPDFLEKILLFKARMIFGFKISG